MLIEHFGSDIMGSASCPLERRIAIGVAKAEVYNFHMIAITGYHDI